MNNQSETTNNEVEQKERAWLLSIQGKTQTEIAKEIGVDQSTISRWLSELRNEGKKHLDDLAHEGVGYLLHQTLEGLNLVISTAWQLYQAKPDHRILQMLGNLYLQRGKLLADIDLVSMRKNASGFVWHTLPLETKIKIEKNKNNEKMALLTADAF